MTHSTRTRRPGRGPVAGQQALLTAATRRGPAAVCDPLDAKLAAAVAAGVPVPRREVASHLSDRTEREIRFDDLPAENPDLLTARPVQTAVRAIPRSWLQPVGLLSTHTLDERIALCDEAAFDFSYALVQLACAVSDLAVAPGGAHALTMLFAPVAGLLVDEPFPSEAAALMAAWAVEATAVVAVELSEVDRRPLGRPVGFELETAVAA